MQNKRKFIATVLTLVITAGVMFLFEASGEFISKADRSTSFMLMYLCLYSLLND